MAARYKEYVDRMISENKDLFDRFVDIHERYGLDQSTWQEKFNEEGAKVMDLVHEYENRLCSNTERGMYNKFSGGLSEKFMAEVRKRFSMIDHVGLIVEKPAIIDDTIHEEISTEPAYAYEESFTLKKINL